MSTARQIVWVCALAVIQSAAPSAHALHHVVVHETPEQPCCEGFHAAVAHPSPETCAGDCAAQPVPPHDCGECFLCEASEGQIAQTGQQNRSSEHTTVAPAVGETTPNTVVVQPVGPLVAGIPPAPAKLHAIMLPLLS